MGGAYEGAGEVPAFLAGMGALLEPLLEPLLKPALVHNSARAGHGQTSDRGGKSIAALPAGGTKEMP